MCGISGFIDFNSVTDKSVLIKMTDTLIHRGPDASGYFYKQNSNCSIGLGHRRLSIIDLSRLGNQPMNYLSERYWIVFNGEIYNYQEVKEELLLKNHHFSSHSDTEVILHAFHEWGDKAVLRFIGMFAFVIYDIQEHKIFCCRDRAGVKPFFYYWDNNLFLFGSELKALMNHTEFKKDINIDSVGQFMQFGYIPEPQSIFKNTFKLQAGHWLSLDLGKKEIKKWPYWSVSDIYKTKVSDLTLLEAIKETEKILEKAFNYRMIADVPVGVFLSGGYDSTCLAALIQKERTSKIKTFTIGFEVQSMNEAPFAKEIASILGTDHQEYICTINDAFNIVQELPFYYDEPFADSSAIPTILVSRMARKQVTVALSADAGDEIFGGYGRYSWIKRQYGILNTIPSPLRKSTAAILNSIKWDNLPFFKNNYRLQKKIEKASFLLASPDVSNVYLSSIENYSEKEKTNLFNTLLSKVDSLHMSKDNEYILLDPVTYAMQKDYQTYLVDDILQKVDRATMSVSLEGREPFLDHNIIEWAASLPLDYKIHNGCPKYILKEIVHQYLPKNLMNRKKMGFSVPIDSWLKGELKPLVDKYFHNDYIKKQDIFSFSYVNQIKNSYYHSGNENSYKIWYLLMFQMWYDHWIEQF